MSSSKKKNGEKKSAFPALAILAALLIFNGIDEPEIAIAVIVILVIAGEAPPPQ